MCATICWMLRGWIAPDWALLGALFCALRVGVLSYWMNFYFGGSVPAIGGALASGAVARILWRQQFGHSITWAIGLSILLPAPTASSRRSWANALKNHGFEVVYWTPEVGVPGLNTTQLRIIAFSRGELDDHAESGLG